MLEWELMNDWFLGRISFHPVLPVRVQMDILLERSVHETEKIVRLDLPRIIRPKETAPELDCSSFYWKTGARDPLLCRGGLAFFMTCIRTPIPRGDRALYRT